MMGLEIRELRPENYAEMIALWERAGLAYRPRGRDSPAAIAAQMERDPDLFLGAFVAGKLVGTAIGSDDGRKGWINRLAVDPAYQRRGVARSLIAEVERRLQGRGREIIAALVEDWNTASLALFQDCGYVLDWTILYLSKRTAPWV
jgi:ribosomal protein S18 acetylase RimI-like enzyme